MSFLIKNIILYDPSGAVAGFIEIRPEAGKTHLRLKQNTGQQNLYLSLLTDGSTKVFSVTGNTAEFVLGRRINLEHEIFVCLVKRSGSKVTSVASGAVNLDKTKTAHVKPDAIKEIDAVIKKVCSVDEHGCGECDKCPYREYFFNPEMKQA
jgi:hypothetical protein